MIKVIRATWGINAPVYELTCSSNSDLANLPTPANTGTEEPFKSKGIGIGSTCICTEDSSIHMLGADDVWHKL